MEEEISKRIESKYENQINQLTEQYLQVMKLIQQNPRLAKVKPEILAKKSNTL